MPRATNTTIQCANCGQPVNAVVETIIDAGQDPQAKVRLLTGRINTVRCPNCGTPNTLMAPLLYHDPEKELLIAYVPMELGLAQNAQERVIGDMMRELTSQLPQGSMKGYMFQPRQTLSMQGLIDQVLQADGVTPEMMEEQRARVKLIEMFIQTPDENLPDLVAQYDAQIDGQFFQTLTLMAQRVAQDGRPDVAQQIIETQNRIAELSTFGQEIIQREQVQEEIVAEVAEDINELGEEADRGDFIDLAIRYADHDHYLQALVGLVRPVFDYTLLQDLTTRIGQAPAAEHSKLEALRDRLVQLTAAIDQQTQAVLQEAARLLQMLLMSDNPDQMIRENLAMFDYTFMQVLAANIQEAERQRDINAAARLKNLYERIINVLQEAMPPELRFINELLSTQSDEDAQTMLAQHAGDFGAPLLDAMDVVGQQLAAGQGDPQLMQRLAFLRDQAAQVLN